LNTITIIDQLGQFMVDHIERSGSDLFGGKRHNVTAKSTCELALDIFPFVRGRICDKNWMIGHFSDLPRCCDL